MKRTHSSSQHGFTLVELLLALAVFSFVLVFVTTAFLQLFRTYNRGVTRKEVNQNTRLLIDDITDKMRIVSDPALIDTSQVAQGRLCIGSYSYVWNKLGATGTKIKVNGQEINIVRIDGDNLSACQAIPLSTNFTSVQATSMFSGRMGVQSMTVVPQVAGVTGLFSVAITASTTQTTFLDSLLTSCKADNISTAYCAKVSLQETVGLRNR